MRVAAAPQEARNFPSWTLRVMAILRDQFIPREYRSILAGDRSILAEGIAVAWIAKAGDLASSRASKSRHIAQELAERLSTDKKTREVAVQVESGSFIESPDFQRQVMRRLFAPNFEERHMFVEGLAVGNRLPELMDRQTRRSTTDATGIYLLLWFYWPEISELKSVNEVAHALEPFFAENKNLIGVHWDERIRKLANRIGLSFRAKQARRRK
jgi:hypothetical protein